LVDVVDCDDDAERESGDDDGGRGKVCKSHANALGILIRVDDVAAGKILY
jgi:hypothetical protein